MHQLDELITLQLNTFQKLRNSLSAVMNSTTNYDCIFKFNNFNAQALKIRSIDDPKATSHIHH